MHFPDTLQLKMNRKGFGLKAEIQGSLNHDYHSNIIEEIKKEGYCKNFGDVAFYLAKEFGFCYGVDRAVELAYETIKKYPNKRIFLSTEIIHNPLVNSNLIKMGIRFLSGPYQHALLDEVTENDVVLVPAFGTTIAMLTQLMDKRCELVDTICASVIVVWKRVEKYAQEGFTVVVHGKYYHEETQATTSRVTEFPHGKYLTVLNKDEASYVCNYIMHGGSEKEFLKKFSKALSPHFNPEVDLEKIGLANQTTMLSSESLHIADMFKKVLIAKYGVQTINEHFRSFDTICNATQERQDAVLSLKDKKVNLIIVIGGYNSSNTNHLCELAETIAPTYHIDRAECIVSAGIIKHKPFGHKQEIESKNWLPKEAVSIGITAGASTPNQEMGKTIERIISFREHTVTN